MSQSAALSVSVPAELAKTVRKRVGSRGLSGFVARAIRHKVEREQLGDYLGEPDAELGPVSDGALQAARRVWPKR